MPYLHRQTVYGIDQRPPWRSYIVLSLQLAFKFSAIITYPIVLGRIAGADWIGIYSFAACSLIAAAIITLLHSSRRLGSGYLAPATVAISYYAAMLAASKAGLPELFGMTLLAGLFQMVLTLILRPFRRFFTPTLAGVIVLLLGMWLGELGIREMFEPEQLGQVLLHGGAELGRTTPDQWRVLPSIGMLSLAVMCGMRVWNPRHLRQYSLLVAMIVGWILAAVIGYHPLHVIPNLDKVPWFALPTYTPPRFPVSIDLYISFGFAALVSTITMWGLFASVQKIQTAKFEKLDTERLQRVNLITGFGIALSGLLGGVAQATAPGGIGLQHATGVYSRSLAVGYAVLMLLLAFCPKILGLLIAIPASVNGAALIYLGSALVIVAFGLLKLEERSPAELLALGIACMLSLSVDTASRFYYSFKVVGLHVAIPHLIVGVLAFLLMKGLFVGFEKINLSRKHG